MVGQRCGQMRPRCHTQRAADCACGMSGLRGPHHSVDTMLCCCKDGLLQELVSLLSKIVCLLSLRGYAMDKAVRKRCFPTCLPNIVFQLLEKLCLCGGRYHGPNKSTKCYCQAVHATVESPFVDLLQCLKHLWPCTSPYIRPGSESSSAYHVCEVRTEKRVPRLATRSAYGHSIAVLHVRESTPLPGLNFLWPACVHPPQSLNVKSLQAVCRKMWTA